ncbi:mitochondrial proton/calcium exchanger protein-like protein isoform X1 [Tanacetum coccineum]
MLRAFLMSLTRAASHWLRNKPSGSIPTWEDLKIKFLSKYCPHARTAKKMEEINNFQQEPDETLYQAWERFKELLMKCPQHYLTEMQEVILFYNGLDVQTRQILDLKEGGYRAAVLGFYQRNNANPSYQERRQSMEETLSKFMIKEIRDLADAAVRNQGASIKTLEIQIGQISKVLQERGFGSLPSSTKANPRNHVKSISTTAEADSNPIRHIRSPQYVVSTPQDRRFIFNSRQTTIPFPSCLNDYYYKEKNGSYGPQFLKAYSYEASYIDKSIPQKEKDPGSFTLPCYINNVCFDNALADFGASVSVMPFSTYLNLGLGKLAHTKLTVELADKTVKYPKRIAENVLVGDEKIIFKSVKPASSLIKRVYMLSLRERMKLDLEARLMGETLVLNRSLDPLYGDYIELNDLNVPLELRRDQVVDLMPTIEEVVSVNMMSREFYNSIIRDKVELKGKNIAGAFMNIPIFVRNFSVVTHFVVVENMDGYRDQDMGDIILEEPFYKASCVEAKRFDGLITIHNGSDNVTYQMA